MCVSPLTQAEWLVEIDNDDDYTLLSVYTKGAGRKQKTALMIKSVGYMNTWVYNIYSSDGADFAYFLESQRDEAERKMLSHGFKLVEPTVDPVFEQVLPNDVGHMAVVGLEVETLTADEAPVFADSDDYAQETLYDAMKAEGLVLPV